MKSAALETSVYTIMPPTFYGRVSVLDYTIDLDPDDPAFNEQTEDDPGVPIGRDEAQPGRLVASSTGRPGSTRILTWPTSQVRVWASVKQGNDWVEQEVNGGSITFTEDQPPTIKVVARDKDALPPEQKVIIKMEGKDAKGDSMGSDSVTLFVPPPFAADDPGQTGVTGAMVDSIKGPQFPQHL